MQPLPSPDLDNLQQNDAPTFAIVSVPVAVDGPVHTHELPARVCAPFKVPLTTDFAHVVGPNLKRRSITLIGDAAWLYSRSGAAGSGVPVPANVVVRLTHADGCYAAVPTSTGNLSVFPEIWAD